MEQLPSTDSLYDGAACGLLLTETNGIIRRANETFCQWLGYQQDELVDTIQIQQLFTMGGRLFHHTHWSPLLQMQGSVSEVQINMVHRDGHSLPMLVNVVRRSHEERVYDELAVIIAKDRKLYEKELLLAQQNAENSLNELQAVQRQLSEVNQQLSAADRRKDEFLATLAHELRNPMAPIRNVLEVLQLKEMQDPHLVWARDVLSRQTLQMTHLIDDLLDVSRITHGRVILRKEAVDFTSVVRDAIDATRQVIESAGHQLSVELPENPIILNADAVRLNQIATNLLTNAAKYTPPGGQIHVGLTQQDQVAELQVRDSGIGIAKDDLSRVFNMFSQVTSALDRAQGGLGIGLALVRGLVELHGGTIRAESEGLNKGSTFIVCLPTSDKHPTDVQHESTSWLKAKRERRVLLIDDNVDAAETLAMALDMLGYTTSTAHDGMEGLQRAEELRPEAILLDIGLPDINGYEVARRIRREPWGESLLLVAITGWGQPDDINAALAAGFDKHLTKPVALDQLASFLEK